METLVHFSPFANLIHSSAALRFRCPCRGKKKSVFSVALLNDEKGISGIGAQLSSLSCLMREKSTGGGGGLSVYLVGVNVTPDSVAMFEFVRYPTTSSRSPWLSVMWIIEVCRPSFVSLTVNFAGPASVRFKKSRCRAIV